MNFDSMLSTMSTETKPETNLKPEPITSSTRSLDQDSAHSDDSFKTSKTSASKNASSGTLGTASSSSTMGTATSSGTLGADASSGTFGTATSSGTLATGASSVKSNDQAEDGQKADVASPKESGSPKEPAKESTSKENAPKENSTLKENSTPKDNSTSNTSKDVSKASSKDNLNEPSSRAEASESTPSSSSIDLEQMISNLDISDDNNELTNSLITLIHKRSSLHESVENRARSQKKKLSIVSLDFDGVVDYIREKKCSRIIVMAGAGISTSAGIPDFRSPNSGIFAKMKKYKLPSPECVFEINYFKSNPKPFFELGAEIFTNKKYKPTPTHNFIKLLDEKGLLLRMYSQNIDGLEAECGLSDERVVYAHGSFNRSHCLACNAEYDFEFMKKFMSEERKEVVVPRCQKCNAKSKNIIKPDIVFYGQSLPEIFFERLESDFPQCDLLLIMGTSLVVQPFASLVNQVNSNVPRILINRERVGVFLKYDRHSMSPRTGLTDKGNDRDIFLQGDSDKIVQEIAEQLGWSDDLERLNKKF